MWFAELSCRFLQALQFSTQILAANFIQESSKPQFTLKPLLPVFLTERARNAWRPSVRCDPRGHGHRKAFCLRGSASPADHGPGVESFDEAGERRTRDPTLS